MVAETHIRANNVQMSIPVRSGRRSLRSDPGSVLGGLLSKTKNRKLRPLIRGVSFEFQAGDRIGLIGQNGAGKTTLLRLLAGVLAPSAGTLEIGGSTQTLLNVSMGMQGDATGLENIYLRGYSAGLSGSEIKERVPEIIEFTGLESVIHDPVRTYSSGMRMRLGFAVATSIKPEILLLDEWISTGDRFFVQRSKERLLSHIASSEILVFASHNAAVLRELCGRGLVLKQGRVVFDGDMDAALAFYESDQYQDA
jgi:homopolymeric O-antigen transport system ATP-binding protein